MTTFAGLSRADLKSELLKVSPTRWALAAMTRGRAWNPVHSAKILVIPERRVRGDGGRAADLKTGSNLFRERLHTERRC